MPRGECLAALVLATLWLSLTTSLSDTPRTPRRDALRYIDYALNLSRFGTFGLTDSAHAAPPPPGNENAPLYPLFLSLYLGVDPELREVLLGWSRESAPEEIRERSSRPLDPVAAGALRRFRAFQQLLGVASALLIWCLARALFSPRAIAWGALVAALLSMSFERYSQLFLTDLFVLPFFFAMQMALVGLVRGGGARTSALLGVSLGLLTLIRPEYLYVTPVLLVTLLAFGLWRGRKPHYTRGALLAGALFLATIAPWALRNQVRFGSPALIGRNYGAIVLTERMSYQSMSWKEGLASLLYWLPDLGEPWSRGLLPASAHERFDAHHEHSFFAMAHSELLEKTLAAVPRDEVPAYWFRREVLGRPVRYVLVTLSLAWRGVFIAKYFGLLGVPACVWLLARRRPGRCVLLWLAFPCVLLVGLHAAVSVSMPRYNLPLLGIYSIALSSLGGGILATLDRKRTRPAPDATAGYREIAR